MQGAKVESRVHLLRELKSEGKALKGAVEMGRKVGSEKQVPIKGDGIDWNVVSFIMDCKLTDAEQELKLVRRKKHQVKTTLKQNNMFMKDARRCINKARNKATMYMREKEKKNAVKISRTKKEEKL